MPTTRCEMCEVTTTDAQPAYTRGWVAIWFYYRNGTAYFNFCPAHTVENVTRHLAAEWKRRLEKKG